MPCHVISRYPETLCGVDFSKLEEPHPHSYVESSSRRLEMANCRPWLRAHHEEELERLDEEESVV